MLRRPARPVILGLSLALFAPLAVASSADAADAAKEPAKAPATAPATEPTKSPATAPATQPKKEQKEPTLKVGDPAPKLSASKWLKGEPVSQLDKGTIYVMEFWATWCGPCIAAMPHVTHLQAEYKDKNVVVIGVNIWERGDDLATKVAAFVEKNNDKMGYRVALEEPIEGSKDRGRMATDWMAAAGRNGIPCSMIVDKEGKVAWIGHPMWMDEPLKQVVAGTFDAMAYAELEKKVDALDTEAMEAAKAKEYDKALAIRDQIVALMPSQAEMQAVSKLRIYLGKGDAETATKSAGELIEKASASKNRMTAEMVTSTLLMYPGADKLDPALALKAAELAYELSGGESLAHQRMLAQACAKAGKFARAVELQEKVVGQLNGPMKDREQKVLEEYKAKAAG